MQPTPPRSIARCLRIALALIGPFAAFAAIGAYARGLAEVRANRYLPTGYPHTASWAIEDTVVRALALVVIAAGALTVLAWVGLLLGRRLRGFSLLAYGLLAAWTSLVVSPATSWRVLRTRGEHELPNLLWNLRDELVRVRAGEGWGEHFTIFFQRELLWQPTVLLIAGILLYLFFGRSQQRSAWPGKLSSSIGGLGLLVGALLGGWTWAHPRWIAPPTESTRHDVVYVTWDSTRADHLSAYGYERNTTPELSRFAEDAVLYERAYSQHNWTRPSYMSIHTGRQGWEFVLRHGIERSKLTLAEALKNAGYRTHAFIQNPNLEWVFKFDQGFDRYVQVHHTDRPGIVVNRVERALDELTADDTPFFLFVHFEQPHWPYEPDGVFGEEGAPEWKDEEVGRLLHEHTFDPAEWNRTTPEGRERLRHLIDLYDSDLYDADRALGRLTQALAERGRLANALIVFNSDHGDEFLEHDSFGHAHANVHPEVTHVPLVLRYPDKLGIEPTRIPYPVQNLDIFPTVLDVLGLRLPEKLQGRSLLALTAEEANSRLLLSSEGGLLIVRQGERGFVHDYLRNKGPFYYDLARDPAEASPLSADEVDAGFREIEEFARWWGEEIGSKNEGEGILPEDAPAELRERLEALGYF